MTKVNDKLLRACLYHAVPTADMLEMLKPLEGLRGAGRIAMQNRIAEEIETKYPYEPGREPEPEEVARQDN